MKVDNTRLDAIRSLVKKLKTEKIEGAQGIDSAGGAAAADAAKGAGNTAEVSAAGYGELQHAVGEKQLARDVELVLQAMDPAREAKIQGLKAQIEAGTYKVDADALAGRMMSTGLFDEA